MNKSTIVLLLFSIVSNCYANGREFRITCTNGATYSKHITVTINSVSDFVWYRQNQMTVGDLHFDWSTYREIPGQPPVAVELVKFDSPTSHDPGDLFIPWGYMCFTVTVESESRSFWIDFRDLNWTDGYVYQGGGNPDATLNIEIQNSKPEMEIDVNNGESNNSTVVEDSPYSIWQLWKAPPTYQPSQEEFMPPVAIYNAAAENEGYDLGGSLYLNELEVPSGIKPAFESANVTHGTTQATYNGTAHSSFKWSGVNVSLSPNSNIYGSQVSAAATYAPNDKSVRRLFKQSTTLSLRNVMIEDPTGNAGTLLFRNPTGDDSFHSQNSPFVLNPAFVQLDEEIGGTLHHQYAVQAISSFQNNGLTYNWATGDFNPTSSTNVFLTGPTSLNAYYKASRASTVSSATGVTSQRKMINVDGTLHALYESAGEVWYTKSTDNGQNWSPEKLLSRGSGTAHNPSISEVSSYATYAYAVWVDATNRPGGSGYDIQTRKMNISTGVWSDQIEAITPGEQSQGFASQNAHPAAISYQQNAESPWVVIAYEKPSGTGLKFSWYGYYEEFEGYGWTTQEIGTGVSGLVNPSISLTWVDGNTFTLTMNTSSTVYRTAGYFYEDPNVPYVGFTSFDAVPSSGSLSNITNSVIDIDGTGREHITWCAFDNDWWMNAVLHRSRDWYGNWSPLHEWIDDMVESPDVSSTISAHFSNSAATLIWTDIADGAAFDEVSTDGVNWVLNSLINLPQSKLPNTVVKSATWPHTLYTQSTSSPYAVRYRLWDNSNRLPKGTVEPSANPAKVNEKVCRRVEFVDKDPSFLTVELGNVAIANQSECLTPGFVKLNPQGTNASVDSFLVSSPFGLSASQSIYADVRIHANGWKLGGTVRIELEDDKTGELLASLGRYDCADANTQAIVSNVSQQLSTNSIGRTARLRCRVVGLDTSNVRTNYITIIRIGDGKVSKNAQSELQRNTVALPKDFGLSQNYPNPFNPTTALQYQLPVNSTVRLEIYDMAGRRVETLVDGEVAAGYHTVSFKADRLSSGTYVYRLQATPNDKAGKRVTEVKKMVLLK